MVELEAHGSFSLRTGRADGNGADPRGLPRLRPGEDEALGTGGHLGKPRRPGQFGLGQN